jgi:hypothetical protein
MKEKLVQQTMFGTPAEDEQAIILADLRGHLSDLGKADTDERQLHSGVEKALLYLCNIDLSHI